MYLTSQVSLRYLKLVIHLTHWYLIFFNTHLHSCPHTHTRKLMHIQHTHNTDRHTQACTDLFMHMKTHSTPTYKHAHSTHFFYCSLAITLTLICTHIRAYIFGHTCTNICRHESTCMSVRANTMPAKDFCEEKLLRAP